jgi:hypothetical protein
MQRLADFSPTADGQIAELLDGALHLSIAGPSWPNGGSFGAILVVARIA